MSLIDQIRRAKSRLRVGETRIITPDGRELIESRDVTSGAVISKQVGVRPWGFVGDFRPDLQVAEVSPGILLSSQDVAQDIDLLRRHGVTHVINAATGVPNFFEGRLKYLKLNLLDLPTTDILQHFPTSLQFIRDALDNDGRVLVHCNAGVSRSVTIVVAYLMRYNQLSAKAALEHVRSIRACARPNDGFVRQLFDYETVLTTTRNAEKDRPEKSKFKRVFLR